MLLELSLFTCRRWGDTDGPVFSSLCGDGVFYGYFGVITKRDYMDGGWLNYVLYILVFIC